MISLSRISTPYGKQILPVDASFRLNPGEPASLVCANGSRETTLFRMIAGEEAPEDGEISIPKRLAVADVRQDVQDNSGRSVLVETILGSGTEAQPHVGPGSCSEYVERTGREAPGGHA